MAVSRYPVYKLFPNGTIVSIQGRETVYVIHPVGSNSGNSGVTLDYFKTRRMVLKYERYGVEIDRPTFIRQYNKIYITYLLRIAPEQEVTGYGVV